MRINKTLPIVLTLFVLLSVSVFADNVSILHGWNGTDIVPLEVTSDGALKTTLNLSESTGISPELNTTYDLGSMDFMWRDLYIASIVTNLTSCTEIETDSLGRWYCGTDDGGAYVDTWINGTIDTKIASNNVTVIAYVDANDDSDNLTDADILALEYTKTNGLWSNVSGVVTYVTDDVNVTEILFIGNVTGGIQTFIVNSSKNVVGAIFDNGSVQFPKLTSCDTINTTDDGFLICGTDGGGAGGESNTASNVGLGGVGTFYQKTGVDLEFRNLNVGSDGFITVTEDVGNVEIDIGLNTLNVSIGGTGQTTFIEGDLLYGDSNMELSILSGETTGTASVLWQNGSGASSTPPEWKAFSLPSLTDTNGGISPVGGEYLRYDAANMYWDAITPTFVSGSGTQYYIPFWNAAGDGLNSTSNFYYDNDNNYFAQGVTAPSITHHIAESQSGSYSPNSDVVFAVEDSSAPTDNLTVELIGGSTTGVNLNLGYDTTPNGVTFHYNATADELHVIKGGSTAYYIDSFGDVVNPDDQYEYWGDGKTISEGFNSTGGYYQIG